MTTTRVSRIAALTVLVLAGVVLWAAGAKVGGAEGDRAADPAPVHTTE